ncbi:M23 family metallopeptidase [Candidatus Woesearchaeota archaeon]|nr:M23 family metallopeptidase [Candidatus Woesearchaeota archaeon]
MDKVKLRLKNRKAQVYPLFVVVFTIVALTTALIGLSNAKEVTDLSGREMLIGTKQSAVFASLQDADAVSLFIEQAAEFAGQQALDKIRKSCFFGVDEEQEVDEWESPCGKFVYPLWSTNENLCLPDCETAFVNAFNKDFLSRTNKYYEFTNIELPISYNMSLEIHDNHFFVHGTSDTELRINVVDIQSRIKSPLAIAQTYEEGRLIWPVDYSDHTITSCFGERDVVGGSKYHPAVDIRAPKGTPVLAAALGKVILTDPCWGRIVINHGSGLSTEYLHLEKIDVKVNDDVVQGQRIGTSGSNGCDTREFVPHLHFGVIYQGVQSPMHYKGQEIVLSNNHIQPMCLIEKGYAAKPESNCNQLVNTDLDKICELYNLPEEFFESSESSKPSEPSEPDQDTSSEESADAENAGAESVNAESTELDYSLAQAPGSYAFKPSFTLRVNKKIENPIEPVTEWFENTWNECEDDPWKCLREKMSEFNEQDYDYKLMFADRCEEGYHLFYDILEFFEDCFSNQKYGCSCEFNLSDAFSITDLRIVFDTQANTASLFSKQGDKPGDEYELIDSYQFYYGSITKPAPASPYRYYVYQLDYDDYGELENAELMQMKSLLDVFDVVPFFDYKELRLAKPGEAEQGYFVNTETIQCKYKKNKFRLCAKPAQEREDLFPIRFAFHLKDKPPEPVKKGDVEIIEVEESSESDVDKVMQAAGFLGTIFPPLGYLFTAINILSVLEDFKPRKFEVIVDVPLDKDGKPLDVAGYEVYCSDYLTNILPVDVLDKYNPSHFVVMANDEMNKKVSQLDQYVKKNPYTDFLNLESCDVPVSKFTGETILVPGIKGVVKDGKMVFNLHKCGDLAIIIDKLIRKDYCVSLIPVDKNGNKIMEHAVSNCAQTNSLLDLVISEMIEEQLGEFIPASLIPDNLKPYIKLPDTSDIVNAVTGEGSFDMIDIVNLDKLDADIKNYLEEFVVGTINEDIIGTSVVNSIDDLKLWEKQTVLNTLSNQIKNDDAKTLFDAFVTGEGVAESAKRMAYEKGVGYIDQTKTPEILKEIAKGEDPKSLAYQELVKAAEKELSTDEKKQALLEIARSSSGREVKDKIIEKALEKGCGESYGISAEQAINCLDNEEVENIYHKVLTDYSTPDKVKQFLLDKAIDKFDEKTPDVLKEIVLKRDFKGAAKDMLEKELDKLPDAVKKEFITDILEGRLPDVEYLQQELVKMIPAVNNEYVNALLKDGNVKNLIESTLKSEIEKQLGSFFSDECVAINKD